SLCSLALPVRGLDANELNQRHSTSSPMTAPHTHLQPMKQWPVGHAVIAQSLHADGGEREPGFDEEGTGWMPHTANRLSSFKKRCRGS
ncbi:MAG: hypothetical protein WAV53_18265, partial [Anaerolineae bacterium]